MSEFVDHETALRRILDESRALSRQALRRPAMTGATGTDVVEARDLTRRIARIWAYLDPGPAEPHSLARLGQAARLRLMAALASLPGGDRRQAPRWPMTRPALLRLASHATSVTLLDLGGGGVMLAPVDGLPAFARLHAVLVLAGETGVAVKLETDADRVAHLAFDQGEATSAAIPAAELLDWAAHYEMAIWQATALANDVEQLLDEALSKGEIDAENLLGQPPAGRDPRANLTAKLATVLTQSLPPSPDLVYVVAADRHGHVACDPLGRMGKGRIVDAVGLRTARFATSAVVQTYRNSSFAPAGVVADIAAPVIVRGRRWGCVRIGRDLPHAPRV